MIYPSPWNYLAGMSVAAFLISLATSAQAQEQRFKAVSVNTPDGLTISAQDWGNPNGPEILFIHGFSQASLSWQRQVESEKARSQGRPDDQPRKAVLPPETRQVERPVEATKVMPPAVTTEVRKPNEQAPVPKPVQPEVDNIVRSGKVVDADSSDENIQGVRRFNELLASEARVTATEIQTVGSKGYDGFALLLVNGNK